MQLKVHVRLDTHPHSGESCELSVRSLLARQLLHQRGGSRASVFLEHLWYKSSLPHPPVRPLNIQPTVLAASMTYRPERRLAKTLAVIVISCVRGGSDVPAKLN